MRIILTLLIILLTSAPVLAGTLREFSLQVDGRDRDFRLYSPDNSGPGARPLVIIFHGIASNNELVMEKSLSRFNELADIHGFQVLYPNGLARNWNLGQGEAATLALPQRDDLAYLDVVLGQVAAYTPINQNRIYGVGFSLGGQMAFALACKRPGSLRAVATVSMPLPVFLAEACRNVPRFGVALMHGAQDMWVPYEGGAFPIGPKRRDNYLSHNRSLEYFLALNGCNASREQKTTLNTEDDGTAVVISKWNACTGPSVRGYAIYGGGHTWPLEEQSLASRPVVGRVSQEINAGDAFWDFFDTFK